MTLRLILVRHAKSSWNDPLQSDHDRPLNARGEEAADVVGGWLADQGHHPAQVLSSTAQRTGQTWAHFAAFLPAPQDIRFERDLYHANPEIMLQVLRTARHSPVLMLGHNPGIAAFAEALIASEPKDGDFIRYPTGATTVIDFEADSWATVGFGMGELVAFMTPRRLTG